jgi:hypothetical protein
MQKSDTNMFYDDIINKHKGFKSELLKSLKNHIRNGYYLAIIDNPLKKVWETKINKSSICWN